MLRVGSALASGAPVVVAQRGGEDAFIDLTRQLSPLAELVSLDDLLDLPDAVLREAIAWARQADAGLGTGAVTLLRPLQRPARVRDCGMIRTHLKPACEMMIRRLEARTSPEAVAARSVLQRLVDHGFGPALRFAERDLDSLSGPLDRIVNPGGELDFELELAAVIRRAENGQPEIFGYTLYNDWTLRDAQIEHFVRFHDFHGEAKNFPGSNTFGPMVVLAEDFGDPAAARLRAEVDGELFVEGSLADAEWSFAGALRHLFPDNQAAGHELAGSGTILGGCMFETGAQLPSGATVRLSCDLIGALENPTSHAP